MAEPKTKPTRASVAKFIAAVPNERLRSDAQVVLEMMRQVTGEKPVLWGPSIVGFGRHPVTYADGSSLDWPVCGFSPRKTGLVLYLGGLARHGALLKKLGKHRTGKVCLYLGPLEALDLPTLKALIVASQPGRKRASKPHAR